MRCNVSGARRIAEASSGPVVFIVCVTLGFMATLRDTVSRALALGEQPLVVAGQAAELTVTAVSEQTIRISLSPLRPDGSPQPLPDEPVIVGRAWPPPALRIRGVEPEKLISLASLQVRVTTDPLTVTLARADGRVVQRFEMDKESAATTFLLGTGMVLGLGHGGQQFDRRGAFYPMKNAHGAWDLEVLGGCMPIPWLTGTDGWGILFHQPTGSFDLSGNYGRFLPWPLELALPLDIFVVTAEQPAHVMTEYAKLTGYPHLPPIWTFGYQQSHRTLASREAVLSVARTFREKKLPVDVVIYLGTGFCPSGWNTGHGSFAFNPRAFPDPEQMIRELHALNLHVVLHTVNPPEKLHGRVNDPHAESEDSVPKYWARHLDVFRLGVDGWWPDVGEQLSVASRLARIQMYSEGPQTERPGLRPYALHRTGYAGMQRHGWLWSGDVDSTWKTLEAQVAVGINTGLSGVPYWGTDTGGFVPTEELTGELYVRWFQFSAFCPLFRSHGRAWRLRLPWGWNTGELGPPEVEGYGGKARVPDTKELLNPEVEPICRKYLELRYRLMPYLYSTVRESHETGLPVMRALWLHYFDDPQAARRGDEYLWGRDILVAPVTKKGATSRQVYLPRGVWYDFWTEARVEGGRELNRPVDLGTLPLYVRAGSVLPLGPLKQFTLEKSDEPLRMVVFPGADGQFSLYEDDGISFDYLKGELMRLRLRWEDRKRRFTIALEEGSRVLPPAPRRISVRIASEDVVRSAVFSGKPIELQF